MKGYTPTARSVKAYVVDVPVYAAPEGTTQEDWNNVSHSFTITDTNGVVKTYEVSQNMANPATARAKIYPATGVSDKDGNTYFPVNTWGFAVSPRNLKQYNYQMLLDSLVWQNYTIEDVNIVFTPRMGATQPGAFEAVLVNNAQIIPAAPYTNQTNSVSFNAVEQNSFRFKINNETVAVKNMKSVQDMFDAAADFGILWFRVAGFSNLKAITEVATLKITIGVSLSCYSPSPYAQLIGPWIEAGYPIDADGGDTPGPGPAPVVQTKAVSVTGTEILDVDTGAVAIQKDRILRGRAKKPRWYIVPTTKDKHICNLGGPAAVDHREEVHKMFLKKIGANLEPNPNAFPNLVQDKFDAAVSGAKFLDDVKAGDDVRRVALPSYPTCSNPKLYIAGGDIQIFEGNPSGSDTRFQLAYYPSPTALNSRALAQGGVGVSYEASAEKVGSRVGVTFKFATSFAPGTVPLIGEFADAVYQPSSGYDSGIAGAVAVDVDDGENTLLSNLCAVIAAGAKVASQLTKNEEGVQVQGVNAYTNSDDKYKKVWKSTETNGDIAVQATAIEVPANAAFCTIGAYPSGDNVPRQYAEGFFDFMPQAAKYGLQKLDSEKITNDQARLTISGQVNTLHQAMIAIEGTASNVNQLPFNVDVQESLVLVASRVNPVDDPQGFYETAIPVTSILDSINTTGSSDSMFINAVGATGGRLVLTKTNESAGRIRVENSPLAGFGYAAVVSYNPCNFTTGFPDYLYDKQTDGLTPVNVGDKIFFSIIKSSAVTYSHTINETTGTYNFWVLPYLAEGADKISEEQAARRYILTRDPAAPYRITAIEEEATLAETVYMAEDAERRFTLECTTPAGDAAAGDGVKRALRCKKM
jgi:hypothetical protein